MIDIIIPFLFGLMVGAAGGVMIAALLVASRESEKIGAKWLTEGHDLIRRDDAIEAVYTRIKQIGYGNDPYVLSIRQAIRDVPPQPSEAVRYVGGVIPDAEQAAENIRRSMRKLYGTPVYETDARIGKWIVLTDKTVKCPKCGKCFADAYDMDHADRFCRNCGECMEGEQ